MKRLFFNTHVGNERLIFFLLPMLLLIAQGAMTVNSQSKDEKSNGILRIYLARHGQTDWNLEHRLQGWTDIPLNETGRRQAHELAARIKDISIERVYSSTLKRSRETAEIAAGNIPIESLPGLREQSVGKFEGKHMDGSNPEIEKEYDRRKTDPNDNFDNGESNNQHFARVKETVEAIVKKHPSGNILIVGHGGTNSQIIRALLNLTMEQAAAIHQENDELYLIELPQGKDPLLWKFIPKTKLNEL